MQYNTGVVVENVLFTIRTPLGVRIRTTKAYWERITATKHPSIGKHRKDVQEALRNPDEIRRSNQDTRVYLHYKNIGKIHVCVVADHEEETEGYIITAYLTDRIKEGEQVYVKDKDLL